MKKKLITKTANDRINYILRDLLSKGYCKLLGEDFYKTQNSAYRAFAFLALDMQESIGFVPSKQLEDMITNVVWNGEEYSEKGNKYVRPISS